MNSECTQLRCSACSTAHCYFILCFIPFWCEWECGWDNFSCRRIEEEFCRPEIPPEIRAGLSGTEICWIIFSVLGTVILLCLGYCYRWEIFFGWRNRRELWERARAGTVRRARAVWDWLRALLARALALRTWIYARVGRDIQVNLIDLELGEIDPALPLLNPPPPFTIFPEEVNLYGGGAAADQSGEQGARAGEGNHPAGLGENGGESEDGGESEEGRQSEDEGGESEDEGRESEDEGGEVEDGGLGENAGGGEVVPVAAAAGREGLLDLVIAVRRDLEDLAAEMRRDLEDGGMELQRVEEERQEEEQRVVERERAMEEAEARERERKQGKKRRRRERESEGRRRSGGERERERERARQERERLLQEDEERVREASRRQQQQLDVLEIPGVGGGARGGVGDAGGTSGGNRGSTRRARGRGLSVCGDGANTGQGLGGMRLRPRNVPGSTAPPPRWRY